ncbi:hypothetical protein BAE44_0023793 [Dichanthelium oligosanthes]|uniref:Uncharacterized protein n=1 Tax=Dichanthelium oligosanthes TaxID=888268 RepID=A0A1E5UQU8_9POAL|nr:hypothetical protein BAE44_0023793 [Dichanthelium oligosanthes]
MVPPQLLGHPFVTRRDVEASRRALRVLIVETPYSGGVEQTHNLCSWILDINRLTNDFAAANWMNTGYQIHHRILVHAAVGLLTYVTLLDGASGHARHQETRRAEKNPARLLRGNALQLTVQLGMDQAFAMATAKASARTNEPMSCGVVFPDFSNSGASGHARHRQTRWAEKKAARLLRGQVLSLMVPQGMDQAFAMAMAVSSARNNKPIPRSGPFSEYEEPFSEYEEPHAG